MKEDFEFTPTAKECKAAAQAVARSLANQTGQLPIQVIASLAIYGLPLIIAVIFFRESLVAIYFTFFLSSGLAFLISRLRGAATPAVFARYAVRQTVNIHDHEIRQKAPHWDVRWPSTFLHRIHLLDEVLVLEFGDLSWLTFPSRLWESDRARQKFVEEVRAWAPNLLPDLPSTNVKSPFSVINVGAAFGAISVFLIGLVAVMRGAYEPIDSPFSLPLNARTPSAFNMIFGATTILAVIAFFVLQYGLKMLERRHSAAAKIAGNLMIWPVLIFFAYCAIQRG